jgi:hypothetical protein
MAPVDPALGFDEFAVHGGDLRRRPAETDEPELQPKCQRFAECGRLGLWFHSKVVIGHVSPTSLIRLIP